MRLALIMIVACSFLNTAVRAKVVSTGSRVLGRSMLLQMSSTSPVISTNDSKNAAALSKIRSIMDIEGIDAFVVPTDDPHMSEYTALYFKRINFISEFTGSAGTVVLTKDQSLLFTDGRYHTQAEKELPAGWTLMKEGLAGVPTLTDFITSTLQDKQVLGIDPSVHNIGSIKNLENKFKAIAASSGKNIELKFVSSNPIDEGWGEDRPPKPMGSIRMHPVEYAGKIVPDKLESLREKMKEVGAGSLVVSALDEIAWVLNMRGSDILCNPVFLSYLVIQVDGTTTLFIDQQKLNSETEKYLGACRVDIKPYDDVFSFVENMSSSAATDGKVWLDRRSVNGAIYRAAGGGIDANRILETQSPIVIQKACKNNAELEGMRACHIRDGAAMAEFWSDLEDKLAAGEVVDEVDVDMLCTGYRAQQEMFVETSFATIAGVAENGAIMHYKAMPDSAKVLGREDMMLLDSGGQYLDGTTDVTRTVHFGQPSAFQKEMFTRVLKGNIGVDSRVFPVGTAGCLLDAYAREHLWEIGQNFMHGVGHGVGAALNVHEGPHKISPALVAQPLEPGMIVSNEPGYYDYENAIGIRIENLLVVVERTDLGTFGGKGFLGFERLTHIPIQQKLIDWRLMTPKEIAWLNTYHEEVREKVYPLLKTDRARTWLEAATASHV